MNQKTSKFDTNSVLGLDITRRQRIRQKFFTKWFLKFSFGLVYKTFESLKSLTEKGKGTKFIHDIVAMFITIRSSCKMSKWKLLSQNFFNWNFLFKNVNKFWRNYVTYRTNRPWRLNRREHRYRQSKNRFFAIWSMVCIPFCYFLQILSFVPFLVSPVLVWLEEFHQLWIWTLIGQTEIVLIMLRTTWNFVDLTALGWNWGIWSLNLWHERIWKTFSHCCYCSSKIVNKTQLVSQH